MKQLRKLTRKHKQQLAARGLDPKEYGCISDDGSRAVLAKRKDPQQTVTVNSGGAWRRR